MGIHRRPTISIGCGIDVVSSLRAQERRLGMLLNDVLSALLR
jgi:hypothetical protein